jgi:hypothetical protein
MRKKKRERGFNEVFECCGVQHSIDSVKSLNAKNGGSMTQREANRRAAKGAKYLDSRPIFALGEEDAVNKAALVTTDEALADAEVMPSGGWAKKINKDRLDMVSCLDCTLGQLFGDYGDGRLAIGLTSDGALGMGFTLYQSQMFVLDNPLPLPGQSHPDWGRLRKAWIIQIDRRLS